MPVYLVIRKSDGYVENAIKWDGESDYDPGEDYELEKVSGKTDCPWIGWKRDENGNLQPPEHTEQIELLNYAVVRKSDNKVIDFKMLHQDNPPIIVDQSSQEVFILCENEDVSIGWTVDQDGTFSAPTNGS